MINLFTIYISNINERIKKEELIHRFSLLFAECGNILKYHIKRGYAFLTFETEEGFKKALNYNEYFFLRKIIKVEQSKPKITRTILLATDNEVINQISKRYKIKIRNVPNKNITFIDFLNEKDSKKEYLRLQSKNIKVKFV